MAPVETADVGARIRQERERQGLGVREFAKRIGVSASLVSQIETGKTRPSVSTLYGMVSQLGVSLDRLFDPSEIDFLTPPSGPPTEITSRAALEQAAEKAAEATPGAPAVRGQNGAPLVQRADDRKVLNLETGIRWERLSPTPEPEVDFLMVDYGAGAESCSAESLMRHNGREYGVVLEGTLHVTVGFDDYELEAGDSISFESTTPHRLWNPSDTPVHAIWFVVGRSGDRRVIDDD